MTTPSGPILVFDSGLGGLTVLHEVRLALPTASFVYAADTSVFPYGALAEDVLLSRVLEMMDRLIEGFRPALVVIACNTVSTLVLPHLRSRYSVPFVGTVPAIKPAARATKSGLISVLATPGTVKRDYTRGLITEFAADKRVTLVGAAGLAALAEAKLYTGIVDQLAVAREVEGAFVEAEGRQTDTVVLACTHFPLLLDELVAAAPWPVIWINPAAAIARRAAALAADVGCHWSEDTGSGQAVFTSQPEGAAHLVEALNAHGLASPQTWSIPFRPAA